MESQNEDKKAHCYSLCTGAEPYMLTCNSCKVKFHISCLKSRLPSDLVGDIYFKFTCISCSNDGEENFERLKLQWIIVLRICLYNLKLQGGGKRLYFHWRQHICCFIHKHWTTFFGSDKKKSATWHGTVAGCLSNGANRIFMSGGDVLGENGWWTLKLQTLPTLEEVQMTPCTKANRKRKNKEMSPSPIIEGLCKRNSNVLETALSLKEKTGSVVEDTQPKVKNTKYNYSKSDTSPSHKMKLSIPKVKTLQSNIIHHSNSPNVLDSSNIFNSLVKDAYSGVCCEKLSVRYSPVRNESDKENSNSGKSVISIKKDSI